jgi:spermidine synthase
VLPLSLYLITFIIAFQTKPAISRELTLTLQGAAVAVCAVLLPLRETSFGLQLPVHIAAFFATALMCHQRLVSSRPAPAQLTQFYLCLSLGGVVGGAFNAFLAPVLFDDVWEYPIVLALSCLARPWSQGPVTRATWALLIVGALAGVMAPLAATLSATDTAAAAFKLPGPVVWALRGVLGLAVVCAFLVRRQARFIFFVVAANACAWAVATEQSESEQSWRSFFGVLRQSETSVQDVGGRLRKLSHGTTLHGVQAQDPERRCTPMTYYTPHTPLGQVFAWKQASAASLRIGVVGLGTGSLAAYARSSDHMTFFEIDPLVVRIATDPRHFTYTSECAQGAIEYVIGDARLTLAGQPDESFDLLLLDAFSSDAVPAHLLTVEAMRGYLGKLEPDGVLVLHLSNRNLDLMSPALAIARAAGGSALGQRFKPSEGTPALVESAQNAVIVAKSKAALGPLETRAEWHSGESIQTRPWTDDYTNLAGALYSSLRSRWARSSAERAKPKR